MYDIVIKNGKIYDGTKAKAYFADIAVKDGKIASIAQNIEGDAKTVIDAKGLCVSPGFIDIHSHSDTNFLDDDACQSKIFQGVTTELAGQCGFTVFPYLEEKTDIMKAYVQGKPQYIAHTMDEFIERAHKNGNKMAVNLAYIIGHGALRANTAGFTNKATDEDNKKMAEMLDHEMKSGAFGMSLGLGYAPGVMSNQEELNNLGAVVAKYDGIIMSHMRNQADFIYDALEEMFEIYRKTGCRIDISHLKLGGKKNFGHADKLWKYIEDAQKSGIKVTADMYPYEASSSGITNIFPKWSLEGGIPKAAARLEAAEGEKIMESLREQLQTEKDGHGIFVVSTRGKAPYADGKDIYEISQELGIPMAETVAKITVETGGDCQCVFFSMDINDVYYLLKQDVSIGSDGSAYPLDPAKNEGRHHPRNFGTFPCFLRLAREQNMCDLETAIYRITKKSADIIGITDRGVLKEGMAADITIFDGDKIADRATYKNPFQKAEGLYHVIVNGEVAILNGEQTAARAGKFLRKTEM